MQYSDSHALDHRPAMIPALVCGLLSAIFLRFGFLSLFFLIPLGYMALAYNAGSAWRACTACILANILITLIVFSADGFTHRLLNILYFSVLTVGFTWIMAGDKTGRIRTGYRCIIAASTGALALLLLVFTPGSGVLELLGKQAELLSSLYVSSSENDAARRSLIEYELTQDRLMEAATLLMLRGGALASCFLLFFFNRQLSVSLAWFIRRQKPLQSLSAFRSPQGTIWVLSVSLGVILLFSRIKMEIPEIIAWNLLVICAILYLAQGLGIVLFKLRYRSPLLRLLCGILFFVIIVSPGVNAVGLGVLILLGILENWLPLRISRESSASTPGS